MTDCLAAAARLGRGGPLTISILRLSSRSTHSINLDVVDASHMRSHGPPRTFAPATKRASPRLLFTLLASFFHFAPPASAFLPIYSRLDKRSATQDFRTEACLPSLLPRAFQINAFEKDTVHDLLPPKIRRNSLATTRFNNHWKSLKIALGGMVLTAIPDRLRLDSRHSGASMVWQPTVHPKTAPEGAS